MATRTFGDTVSFSANATDAEDGTLPASANKSTVDFGHRTHLYPHVAPTSGITSGTFVADFIEPDPVQFYRIMLEVTDSNGAVFTTFFDVQPVTVNLTLDSIPAGIPMTIDGQPVDGPELSVVGTARAIQAPDSHTLFGTAFDFASWSDGGAATHTITPPDINTTFTAHFRRDPLITWNDPAAVVFGTPLSAVQLNAAVDVAGTFIYNPPADTILNAGMDQQLSVTFTPDDTENYNTATVQVSIDVLLPEFDYGDAPSSNQSGFEKDYAVSLAQDGARHLPSCLYLGALIDVESDGHPDAATVQDESGGDDHDNQPDEDEDYLFTIADGAVSPNVNVDAVQGTVLIMVDSGRIVVRSGEVDLFRAPLANVGSLSVAGSPGGLLRITSTETFSYQPLV